MGEAIRFENASDSCSDALVDAFVAAMREASGTFAEREVMALQLGNKLVRRWIEHALQQLADEISDEVRVSGETYRRGSVGTGRYHTLCGPVVVQRASYRLVGVHNGPTVVPLELKAELRENATPALAFSVTQGFAERPLRHYELEMAAAHRATPSRSTLERIGKRIGDAIQEVVSSIEPMVRSSEPVVADVQAISFGLDRTTVPMAEETDAPRPVRRRPYVRAAPRPVEVAYRMAYVGTVSLHDSDGKSLLTKRFAATADEGPDELVHRIAKEVLHQKARYGEVPISVIQDGAPELWNLVGDMCSKHHVTPRYELIDRFHVDERLAAVCEAVAGAGWAARTLYDTWRMQLDRSDTAIDRIIRRLDELLDYIGFGASDDGAMPSYWAARARASFPGDASRIIGENVEYFRNNRKRLRYASSRINHLPVGSGTDRGRVQVGHRDALQAVGATVVRERPRSLPVAQSASSERAIASVL